MASSSPTTSIPIQEPVFLQFLHDVHHAYLLLHRAMALLPPTLIPNIEPTPLPSTDVWHQPDGLRPHYSERTNAFIDAVHIPSPDLAEEETLMDELVEPNLPRTTSTCCCSSTRHPPRSIEAFNHRLDACQTQTEYQSDSQGTCKTSSPYRKIEIPFLEPIVDLDF